MDKQQTFFSSDDTLRYLQSKYGSADYKNWQSGRRQFYSFVQYPVAGQSSTAFFGTALGAAVGTTVATRQDTNIPKAGSFGQVHFLLKAVSLYIYLPDWKINTWAGTDATTFYADMLMGFIQAGVFTLQIGARPWVQLVKPFLYAPPGDGKPIVKTAGIDTLTVTTATPQAASVVRTAPPWAEPSGRHQNYYVLDPSILIEAEQKFQATLDYPSGLVPVISTSVVSDTTNILQIGCVLDGIQFRPVQ